MEALIFGSITAFSALSVIVFSFISTRQSSKKIRSEFEEKERSSWIAAAEADKKLALENQARDQLIISLQAATDAAHDKIRSIQGESADLSNEIREIHSEIKNISKTLEKIEKFMTTEQSNMEQVKSDLKVHIGLDQNHSRSGR